MLVKSKFTFIKNIILVVASALTLVAVSFAWFKTDNQVTVPFISSSVGAEAVKVNFYECNNKGVYVPLAGDIALNNITAGQSKKYRIVVETFSNRGVYLSLLIRDLPSTLSADMKNAVCTKYSLLTAQKTSDGTVMDGTTVISQSNGTLNVSGNSGFVPLSSTGNGNLFGSPILLENYQTSGNDYFVIYYEIGLADTADASVSGKSASLGTLDVSASLN